MKKEPKDTEDTKIVMKKPKHVKGGQTTKPVVMKNGRMVSRFNAIKHGKYAKIPIYCNDCYYRSKEAGGNGKCEAYAENSVCTVREDIKKRCGMLDSRKPEDVKTMVDDTIKDLRERVMFAMFTAGLDGNLSDRATNAQMNTLRDYLRLATELQGSVKVTEMRRESNSQMDAITEIFRSVEASGSTGR